MHEALDDATEGRVRREMDAHLAEAVDRELAGELAGSVDYGLMFDLIDAVFFEVEREVESVQEA